MAWNTHLKLPHRKDGGFDMNAMELKAINMIGQFPEEKIADIIAFMEELRMKTTSTEKPRIGVGKGKTVFPPDIDFCNDEIADLFSGSEK